MVNLISSLPTEDENVFLTSIPSRCEIRETVFQMDPSSALGPDRFSRAFFQVC